MDGSTVQNQAGYQNNGTWQNRDGSSAPNSAYQSNPNWGNVEAAQAPNPTYQGNVNWPNAEGAAGAQMANQAYQNNGNTTQNQPMEQTNGSNGPENQQPAVEPQIPGKIFYFLGIFWKLRNFQKFGNFGGSIFLEIEQ